MEESMEESMKESMDIIKPVEPVEPAFTDTHVNYVLSLWLHLINHHMMSTVLNPDAVFTLLQQLSYQMASGVETGSVGIDCLRLLATKNDDFLFQLQTRLPDVLL